MIAVVPSLDPDRDGSIDADDVRKARGAIAKAMTSGIHVRANGADCPGVLEDAHLTEEDGLALSATYTCAALPSRLEVDVKLLEELSHGHRHIVHVAMGSITVDEVAFKGHETVEVSPSAESTSTEAAPRVDALGFLRMGIEHILTGYDHIVFLFGLVLVGGRVRSLALVVTTFTVAHSITLALATLNVWAPAPKFVEPMIALSIAYVGVENFFVRTADKRWRVTFPFGLIHGFGFASALREIDLPHAQIPSALVLFNLGVEVGQLAIMAALLPIVLYLRKQRGFVPRGMFALSGTVTLVGVFWFLQRLVHG
jgi:hydrogenase/urease accessory protein HupE